MKKLLTLAFLVIGMITNAQIKFVEKEYGLISISVDPVSTTKEKSPNVILELGLVSNWKYIGVSTQVLPGLKGGYIDFTGNFGINLTEEPFNKWRFYSGIRLGLIKRGYTESKTYTYPLAGGEIKVELKVYNNTFIGIKSSVDYRSDFKYSGAKENWRLNNAITIGTTF